MRLASNGYTDCGQVLIDDDIDVVCQLLFFSCEENVRFLSQSVIVLVHNQLSRTNSDCWQSNTVKINFWTGLVVVVLKLEKIKINLNLQFFSEL